MSRVCVRLGGEPSGTRVSCEDGRGSSEGAEKCVLICTELCFQLSTMKTPSPFLEEFLSRSCTKRFSSASQHFPSALSLQI